MTSGSDARASAVVSIVSEALVSARLVVGGNSGLSAALDKLTIASDLAATTQGALNGLSAGVVATADHDAKQLLTLSRAQDPDVGLLLTITNRLVEDLEGLVVAALAQARPRSAERSASASSIASRDESLADLVGDYGRDAARERRTSALLFAASVFAFGVSVAAAVWTVHVARRARLDVWTQSLAPLIVCGAAVLAGLILMRSAVTRGRAAREATRLQRGLAGLDAYLAPLPPAAQHLLRATLAQTLFPRLLEDNDPMRAPVWPDADALLRVAGAFEEHHPSEPSDPTPSDSNASPSAGGTPLP